MLSLRPTADGKVTTSRLLRQASVSALAISLGVCTYLMPVTAHAGTSRAATNAQKPAWGGGVQQNARRADWVATETARPQNRAERRQTRAVVRQVAQVQPQRQRAKAASMPIVPTRIATAATGSDVINQPRATEASREQAPSVVQMAQVVGPARVSPNTSSQPTPAPGSVRLNPTGRTINIVVPIVDNQASLGEVTMTLGADDSVRVGSEPLLNALTPLLDPRALERLRGQVGGRRDLSASEWGELGYVLVYDPARIELKVTFPATDRVSKRVEVAGLDTEEVGNFETPARFSGYLNIRGSVDYVHQGFNEGLGDPNIVFDTALRMGRIVLETEANLSPTTDDDVMFQREGTRLVFDDTARTMRWSLGDVRGQSAGFASTGEVLGLSVFRTYSELAPQRFARPRGEREFVLNRSSSVEAIVNGRSVRKIRLDPGTYKLNDFPFIEGSNDVRLIIEDDTGVREALNFNLFFDRTLLDRGLTEFSFTAGQTTTLGEDGPEYEDGEWIIGGFVRRGFSDRLTAGLNGQFQEAGQLAGIEALLATSIGTFGIDAAASNVDGVGSGGALTLVYNRLIAVNGGRSQNLGVTIEGRTENFSVPSREGGTNPFALTVSAAYSRSFGEFSFGGLDARYSVGRGTTLDQSSLRATFGRRIGARGNLTIDADWRDSGLEEEFGVRLAFTWRFGTETSIRTEYNSRDESVRLAFQQQKGQGVGSYNVSADLDRTENRIGANLALGYIANRADLGYALTTAYDTQSGDISDQRSSLRFGTSFAFADGAFAVGRPISDSFAIFKGHRSLGKAAVIVDPRPEGFISQTGILGSALYGDLSAYSDRSIAIDVPKSPSGYDLGAGSYRVRPAYRSGYSFEVGSDYSVTVIGRLLDRDGQAISLLAGAAIEIAKPDREKVTVFTNREGRFALSGVRAGRWRIEMPTSPPTVYEIVIPEATDGVVRMGDVEAP
jgi:outer membrane usher protein